MRFSQNQKQKIELLREIESLKHKLKLARAKLRLSFPEKINYDKYENDRNKRN